MFEGLAEIRSYGYFLRDGEVSGRGSLRGLVEAADKVSTRLIVDATGSELVLFNHPLLLDAQLYEP